MGSFESWDKLVRGALIWVGESDPLAGRERIRQDSDPERDALRRLLVTWQEVYGDGARTLAEVRRELQDCESLVPRNGELTPDDPPQVRLRDALCVLDWKSDGKNWNARVVGNVIRRSKGRILDGLKFTSFGSKYAKWKVEGNGIRGINGISTTPYQETSAYACTTIPAIIRVATSLTIPITIIVGCCTANSIRSYHYHCHNG